MRRRRTAGERYGFGPRRSRRHEEIPQERATAAQAALATFWLSALDLEALRRVWSRRTGGSTRDFADGSIEVLTPGGERITRGTPTHIEEQLRARLTRVGLHALP